MSGEAAVGASAVAAERSHASHGAAVTATAQRRRAGPGGEFGETRCTTQALAVHPPQIVRSLRCQPWASLYECRDNLLQGHVSTLPAVVCVRPATIPARMHLGPVRS